MPDIFGHFFLQQPDKEGVSDLPSNNVTSGDFGTISATISPATSPYGAFLSVPLTGRIVQLNARVTF